MSKTMKLDNVFNTACKYMKLVQGLMALRYKVKIIRTDDEFNASYINAPTSHDLASTPFVSRFAYRLLVHDIGEEYVKIKNPRWWRKNLVVYSRFVICATPNTLEKHSSFCHEIGHIINKIKYRNELPFKKQLFDFLYDKLYMGSPYEDRSNFSLEEDVNKILDVLLDESLAWKNGIELNDKMFFDDFGENAISLYDSEDVVQHIKFCLNSYVKGCHRRLLPEYKFSNNHESCVITNFLYNNIVRGNINAETDRHI